MAKCALDDKILRSMVLRGGIPAPMRALLIYLIAVTRGRPYTCVTNEKIKDRVGIGKQYSKLMAKLEALGLVHRLTVTGNSATARVLFVNKHHPWLRRWDRRLKPESFVIARKDVITGVLDVLARQRSAPNDGACPDKGAKAEIVARCLKTLRERGVEVVK